MIIICSVGCARQGVAPLPAQVRLQRGGEVCPERQQGGASIPHRGGLHRKLRQPELAAAHHDEGPVRQLRGPEDDRRGGDQPAQDPDAQDPATHLDAAEVHVREAHPRQDGEILSQEQHRPRPYRTPGLHVTLTFQRCWCVDNDIYKYKC